jgi:hypothetical protein
VRKCLAGERLVAAPAHLPALRFNKEAGMPSRRCTPPAAQAEGPVSATPSHPTAGSLTNDQVRRWAGLIAEGQDEFPKELAAADGQRLLTEVRSRLRDRLLDLVARAAATHIQRRRSKEARSHA